MRIDRSEWRRKHDDRLGPPRVGRPAAHFFPETRDDLIKIVQASLESGETVEVRACGSHWALSHAAVTDSYIVETRGFSEPDGVPTVPRLNNTLYDVIPGCLSDTALSQLISQPARPYTGVEPDLDSYNYYHVEAGARIFELYSRLDLQSQNPGDIMPLEHHMPTSRHPLTQDVAVLKGPWAMPTLGGAGGQTIVGAFSTGTHGGDQHLPPIADAVQAIHLIASDANEYWIERSHDSNGVSLALTDDSRLQAVYPGIQVIRDNEAFNAVLVSVGRMGIIYSVVLKVVRQYGLRQVRTTESWSSISTRLTDPNDHLFSSRFLQVVVNPHAQLNTSDHTCYVETREAVGLAGLAAWQGRAQRAGANAGRNSTSGTSDFQSLICRKDAIGSLVNDLSREYGVPEIVLTPLRNAGSLGELVTDLMNYALRFHLPAVIAFANEQILALGQEPLPEPGVIDISYAIMDSHDYVDQGCIPSGDSLTVSFNADETGFLTFIDGLFELLKELEAGMLVSPGEHPHSMSFAGYVSLRFTGRSDALLAMQRWKRTCNIEIAGIKNIEGTDPFLRKLEEKAAALGATIHWGQKNEGERAQVEATFPNLSRWRTVLMRFTDNGRLVNFSTPFSRTKGLEVV